MSQHHPELTRREWLAGTAAALALAATRRRSAGADSTLEPKAADGTPDGWKAAAPRDEIRPQFSFDSSGGPDGHGCLVIRADHRAGLDGCWARAFPVIAGRHYRFAALYRAGNVAVPRSEHRGQARLAG